MSRQFRKRPGWVPAVALSATLLVLVPLYAACGPTPEPETIVQTVEVEKTIVETVEVEKEVEVTRVATPAGPTTAPEVEPTAAPPTAISPGVVVQKELERLASGLIAYNPPTEMTVDKAERVEVRISMDTAASLTEGLRGPGTPVVELIPVSYFMKVRLVGETFDIVALSSEEQVVPAQGYSEWAWDVTPTESGTRNLCLVVTALVKAYDAEGEKDLPIIERQIHVKVNPGFLVSSFFMDNRTWIFTAVLLPLVAAGGRWLWQRQRGRTQPDDPDAGGDAA